MLSTENELEPGDLFPDELSPAGEGNGQVSERAPLDQAIDGELSLRELGDLYIERVLDQTGGNKVRAARILGINRRTLYRRGETSKNTGGTD